LPAKKSDENVEAKSEAEEAPKPPKEPEKKPKPVFHIDIHKASGSPSGSPSKVLRRSLDKTDHSKLHKINDAQGKRKRGFMSLVMMFLLFLLVVAAAYASYVVFLEGNPELLQTARTYLLYFFGQGQADEATRPA
jgi:hypothetical protein